jgi:hypothetical protein
MKKEKRHGLDISISALPNFNGQFSHTFPYNRRVNEEHVIPTDPNDKLITVEGLYPCAVVPCYDLNKTLSVVYRKEIIYLNTKEKDMLFKEVFRGFEQKVVERHIVPKKGKMYYSETEWTKDSTSPAGLYPTVIFPKELIGKVVTLNNQE